MSIQWYPGHMTKARREIAESMRTQDVIIEVLDARMPSASENPMIATLRREKPCIKVLSKSDLADPAITDAWLRHFAEHRREPTTNRPEGTVIAVALRTDKLAEARKRIPELCMKIAGPRTGKRALHAMIVGIPNVGKSTLVNTLMGRKVASASDKPAVTKQQQFVVLENGIALRDNPGIMWPKIEDPLAALRLALAGAIPDTAIDAYDVALFGAEILMARYPNALMTRYKLDAVPESPSAMLEAIGRKRGRLRAGGVVDLGAAATDLIHAFRTGALGPMSLESPP
jgi:ribosome biogenesis GTPase A